MVTQSATAVALISASVLVCGLLLPYTAFALIQTIKLGSALMAPVLILQIEFVLPLALLIGVTVVCKVNSRKAKQVVRGEGEINWTYVNEQMRKERCLKRFSIGLTYPPCTTAEGTGHSWENCLARPRSVGGCA